MAEKKRVAMDRFISPIGFSPNLVTGPIMARGASRGDVVQIVHPEQADETAERRVDNAIDSVRSTLSGAVGDVDVEVMTITETAFPAVVNKCSELIVADPDPVVCLGAGATDIHVPMIVAATAHQGQIEATMMFSDIDATSNGIELPPLRNELPGRARETFRLVGEHADGGAVALPDLADASERSRSTISRHIKTLRDNRFVETVQDGRTKTVSLTPLGEITYRDM